MKEAVREKKIALWEDQRNKSGSEALRNAAGVLLCNIAFRAANAAEITNPVLNAAGAFVPAVGSCVLAVMIGFDARDYVRAGNAIEALQEHKDATYKAEFAAKEPTPPTEG